MLTLVVNRSKAEMIKIRMRDVILTTDLDQELLDAKVSSLNKNKIHYTNYHYNAANDDYENYTKIHDEELNEIEKKGFDKWYYDSLFREIEQMRFKEKTNGNISESVSDSSDNIYSDMFSTYCASKN